MASWCLFALVMARTSYLLEGCISFAMLLVSGPARSWLPELLVTRASRARPRRQHPHAASDGETLLSLYSHSRVSMWLTIEDSFVQRGLWVPPYPTNCGTAKALQGRKANVFLTQAFSRVKPIVGGSSLSFFGVLLPT
ncbi:hypothetical protein LX36DRAFT_96557 [Colletotrichum falcatum]|nr:hypothetical protein LX36DRAFT_96557 [Colletotrichum falcatum]